jgi:hypothetical protein
VTPVRTAKRNDHLELALLALLVIVISVLFVAGLGAVFYLTELVLGA